MTSDWRENARRHWRELHAEDISQHLHLARSRPGTPAGQASFRVLLGHYRAGIERERAAHWDHCATVERDMKDGKITAKNEAKRQRFDPRIADFFTSIARRVWLSADPVAELKRLIGSETPRGRPMRKTGHDFNLAVRIVHLINDGVGATEAVVTVQGEAAAAGRALSIERLWGILHHHRAEATAQDAWARGYPQTQIEGRALELQRDWI